MDISHGSAGGSSFSHSSGRSTSSSSSSGFRSSGSGARRRRVTGVVRDLSCRAEARGSRRRPKVDQIWTFRVLPTGKERSRYPVAVELRGRRIDGVLREGDVVKIGTRNHRSGTLLPARVDNRTTRSRVSVTRSGRTLRAIGAVFSVLLALTLTVAFVVAGYLILAGGT